MRSFRLTVLATAIVLAAGAAHAGRSCEAKPPTLSTIDRAMTLAQKTAAALDASGARVVVLGRAGQDLSRWNIRYSHLGYAYKTTDSKGRPVWRVVHKLNHCGTATAALYRQGLGEFFMDDLWRYEAVWVVPTPELQARLLPILGDASEVARLHHRPYSLVSYAWSSRYQQSNQWLIEVMAQAAESVRTRDQAQAWLQFKGYQPATLRIGALTRLGGRISAANVAFDDHPNERRFSDRIDTVTADSVLEWLTRSGLSGPTRQLSL